jgi:hypothetical protein
MPAGKTAHHPDGVHSITFREDNHSYVDNNGKRYVSGTTFIKPFFPKFDAVAVSERCAAGDNPKYAGRDPGEIRAEWMAEGKRGSGEGDNVHTYIEAVLSGWPKFKQPRPISLRCAFLFWQARRAMRWLTVGRGLVFIACEMIVFSPSLGLAGSIDLLMYDQFRNEAVILDWKQNKEIKSTNQFQSAIEPIDHLQDTDISKYSLQLSLYQHIIEVENYFPGISGFRRGLIHLQPTSFTPIPIEDYNYEIRCMLKHAGR